MAQQLHGDEGPAETASDDRNGLHENEAVEQAFCASAVLPAGWRE
jgi:hypothetical protein